jgi:uncharacterized protein (TIGR03083 family)
MSKPQGDKDLWLGALRADCADFQTVIAEAPLDSPVPSCPGWTIARLTSHLGSVYGYALDMIAAAGAEPPERPKGYFRPAPDADVVAWWQERSGTLLTTMESLDPEAPASNWAPTTKIAGFWIRRMAHETAVHRWDAQFALVSAEPIEMRLAVDGVSEIFDMWLPAGKGTGPQDAVGMVSLYASDAEEDWYVRLRGHGAVALLDTDTILDDDEHPARASAQGTASDLMLALMGRIDLDVLEIAGDEHLLEALRTG